LETELVFSCTVVSSVCQSEGVSAPTAWINIKLTKKQFMLEQNPSTRLSGAEYQEAFPPTLKTLFSPVQNLPTQIPSNMQVSKTGAK